MLNFVINSGKKATYNMYILWGDSQALGRASLALLTDNSLKIPLNGYIYSDVTSKLEYLLAGTNNQPSITPPVTQFGGELSFTKNMSSFKGAPVYLAKYGQSAATLTTDALLVNLKKYIFYTIHGTSNKLILKGIMQAQGGQDASDLTLATNYLTNLNTFYTSLINYINSIATNTANFSVSPNLKKIIFRTDGALDVSEIYRDLVRQAQADYVSTHSDSILVDTDPYGKNPDGHYSVAGELQLGFDGFLNLKSI